jgi:hypothetical protein
MTSSFRRTVQIFTRVPQVLNPTTGLYAPAVETAGTMLASIQPARLSDYDEAKATERGIDLTRTIRIYTDTRLNVANRSTQMPGDIVMWFGNRHIVFAESIYQAMGSTIDHFRYLATSDELTS